MTFVPISFDAYVEGYLRSNPGADRAEVRTRLRRTLEASRSGTRCQCGSRIWVIGSAEVGLACFTCITGEADPSGDYEIEEACSSPDA
jgi:hypothetical protein